MQADDERGNDFNARKSALDLVVREKYGYSVTIDNAVKGRPASNFMRTSILVLLLATSAFAGDTNLTFIIKTNTVKAADWYRIVGGQVYNTKVSLKWRDKTAEYVSGDGLCAKVQMFRTKQILGNPAPGTPSDAGRGIPSYRPVISSERVNGAEAYVLNYSPEKVITQGKIMDFRAMGVEATNISGKNYEVWDCGIVNSAQVISTNRTGIGTTRDNTKSD